MNQWIAEVRARGVETAAAALGLEARHARTFAPCPACQRTRRSSTDARGPIGLTADGLGWHCHRCQKGGDSVALAAYILHGAVPGAGDPAWNATIGPACAARGLCEPLDTAAPGAVPLRAPTPRPAPLPPPPAPRRPPEAEVHDVWTRCGPVTDDADVRAWFVGRSLDPALVVERDLARALPRTGPLPAWCASWRMSTHRVVLPFYGAGGHLETLHARATAPGVAKKAASPRGAEMRGLVMADAAGRALLEGAPPPGVDTVLVLEGPPDFLTWATRYGDAAEDAPAILGVIAGAWGPDIAATIPSGWTVIIRTHADAAGKKYAEAIHASLAGRCVCRWPHTQESTYADTGVFPYAEDRR